MAHDDDPLAIDDDDAMHHHYEIQVDDLSSEQQAFLLQNSSGEQIAYDDVMISADDVARLRKAVEEHECDSTFCMFKDVEPDDIVRCKLGMMSATKSEKLNFILGKISAGSTSGPSHHARRMSERKSTKISYQFDFRRRLCRKCFCFAFEMTTGKLRALQSHLRSHGHVVWTDYPTKLRHGGAEMAIADDDAAEIGDDDDGELLHFDECSKAPPKRTRVAPPTKAKASSKRTKT